MTMRSHARGSTLASQQLSKMVKLVAAHAVASSLPMKCQFLRPITIGRSTRSAWLLRLPHSGQSPCGIDGEVTARGVDGEACPVVEDIGEGFVHRAGFIIAQQRIGAGAVDAFKNRDGVQLASSLAFSVVDVLRVTLDTIQFTDAVEYIFGDEVALFRRDDETSAGVYLRNRGE